MGEEEIRPISAAMVNIESKIDSAERGCKVRQNACQANDERFSRNLFEGKGLLDSDLRGAASVPYGSQPYVGKTHKIRLNASQHVLVLFFLFYPFLVEYFMNTRGIRDLFRDRYKLPLPDLLLAFIVRVVIGSRITLQRSAKGLAKYQCQPRRLLRD